MFHILFSVLRILNNKNIPFLLKITDPTVHDLDPPPIPSRISFATHPIKIIEKYIRPKYSPVLCEILELCTRSLEERPKLAYLESTQFYQQSQSIEKEEIANILRNIS